MVQLTFYGGVSEVGGNKILVEHKDSRVMLDFGARMEFASDFFSDFLDVRSNTKLKDKLTIGLLPMIPGIYRSHLIKPEGAEGLTDNQYPRIISPKSELFNVPGLITYEDYFQNHGRGYLNGILLTHAHLDHTGDIGFIHPDIPLYCSETTKTLVQAIDEITTFKSEAIVTKGSKVCFTKTGAVPGSPKIEHKDRFIRDCKVLGNGQTIKIGTFHITIIDVDHSVPGAASYVLECPKNGKSLKILYTGDIRFHGNKKTTIDDYVTAIGSEIDILLIEGTRIDSESKLTENEVKEKITKEIVATNGLVFVDFSWKDTTRYETIRAAAEASGRTFVINARLAYILNKLGQTPLPDSIKVFLKRKGSCFYSPTDYSTYKHEFGFSVEKDTWIQDASHYKYGITATDIKHRQEKFVLMLSFFDLGQLFDLVDENGKIPGSRFIKAVCGPFCDEMELDEERFINWLDTFGIDYNLGETPVPDGCSYLACEKIRKRIERAHVSGHVSKPEIMELIEKIKPKTLFPIHTEHPEAFEELAKEIDLPMNVIIPKLEKTYSF